MIRNHPTVRRLLRHAPAAIAILFAAQAQAHQVWLERDGQVVRAYFGEPAENRRERTGALLDRISGPRAFAADPQAALPIERRTDHLEIAAPAGSADIRLVEQSLAPSARPNSADRVKTVMLAREGRSETRAAMDLELVPVAAGGNEFVLMLRGQPLPRAEVTVVGPPRWERRIRTNPQGHVTFETPWAGRYVAEVIHTEEQAGGTGDGAYTRLRLVSTLSFAVQDGIAWNAR
ncbi:MAG TPA: DUF4198 domain-containing protein [Roseomonas sp.]